jgi:hypothetical protein
VYCHACEYSLHGLEAGHCPECARAFDPSDPGSFQISPGRTRRKLQYAIAVVLALILGVIAWYCIRAYSPLPLFMVVIAGVPGLTALFCGIRLRDKPPSTVISLLAMAPSIAMVVLFYSLAVHMYQSLGSWPAFLGDSDFSAALKIHADVALGYFGIIFLVNLLILPFAIVVFASIRRLRGALYYLGVYAVAISVGIGTMLLAHGQFLIWWWD